MLVVFFFKQKTAYEMRISDWSSDVCSSDLRAAGRRALLDPAVRLCVRPEPAGRLPADQRCHRCRLLRLLFPRERQLGLQLLERLHPDVALRLREQLDGGG